MNFNETVEKLLEEGLSSREDLFLIDLKITPDKKIMITLDGDRGVTLKDCMDISRAVEHNLDREETDFALEVSSVGASAPLKLARQYKKNVGRTLSVRTAQGTEEGTLTELNDDTFTIKWKAREPKPMGKGKHTVEKERSYAYSEVEEAKVILKF